MKRKVSIKQLTYYFIFNTLHDLILPHGASFRNAGVKEPSIWMFFCERFEFFALPTYTLEKLSNLILIYWTVTPWETTPPIRAAFISLVRGHEK